MIIRIPSSFRLDAVPATATISEDDVAELLAGAPGEQTHLDDEIQISFESPHAAADFVNALGSAVPYVAADMSVTEEATFRSIIGDHSVKAEPAGVVQRARNTAVAALSVAIPAAVVALGSLAVAIVALAV